MTDKKTLLVNFAEGLIDRRSFLKGLLATTGCLSLSGCLTYFYQETGLSSPVNDLQLRNLRATQNHLFPETKNNLDAEQINALEFLQFVLHDQQIDLDDREFLIKGANWINDTSQENFQLNFYQLDQEKREEIFQIITQKSWGENWLSAMLKYIFEALLSDPLYGGNPNSIGWEWLGIQPGYPRPNELNAYPKILKV